MDKMLNPQGRHKLFAWPRRRTVLLVTLATFTTYFLLFSGPSPKLHVVPYLHGKTGGSSQPVDSEKPLTDSGAGGGDPTYFDDDDDDEGMGEFWHIDIEDLRKWKDTDDQEDYSNVESGYERDGKVRDNDQIGNLQHEKDLRKLWRYVYKTTAK
jgi:hypothetical protein